MNKIGLVGYSANTGLGEFVRQSLNYINIKSWLIYPHKTKGIIEQETEAEQLIYTGKNSILRFLKSIDTVLFFETPLIPELIPLAKSLGKKIVCVPMYEWLPENGWISDVDLFVCPNLYSFNLLKETLPCVLFQWPVDTERFQCKYTQEQLEEEITLNSYLYVHGTGGYKDRKGEFVIKDMLTNFPDLKNSLFVVTENPEAWIGFLPKNCIVISGMCNKSIYNWGEVLVAPHRLDGHGLQQYEALASGLPVITSDGSVWYEYPHFQTLEGETVKKKIKRNVDWFNPNPDFLGQCLTENLGINIEEDIKETVRYVEKNCWTTDKSKQFESFLEPTDYEGVSISSFPVEEEQSTEETEEEESEESDLFHEG